VHRFDDAVVYPGYAVVSKEFVYARSCAFVVLHSAFNICSSHAKDSPQLTILPRNRLCNQICRYVPSTTIVKKSCTQRGSVSQQTTLDACTVGSEQCPMFEEALRRLRFAICDAALRRAKTIKVNTQTTHKISVFQNKT